MSDGSVVIEIDGDSGKFQKALSNIGSIAGKALKGLGVASAAAAGAVAAIGKASVTAYADYEQLVGGVETLFKDSASTVMEYANNAYKTAGMSANTYMETATSFAAGLLQSVGNDTAEAARVADMAITDMSDNANKMGTDIGRIQDAYQGFAKQNYTMLDNLKLGYGGTKTEMERLLADAEKISGIKYDISNLNDVYEAIHVIQMKMEISGYSVDELNTKLHDMSLTQEELQRVADSMGISYEEAARRMQEGSLTVADANVLLGTTAKEATETIQGSLAMTKASWENLLVGMADDTQDFDALLNNFIDSVTVLGDNLIPRIQIVLEGIVKLVSALGPKIAETIPGLVESVLPGLLTGVTSIVTAIVDVIPGLLDTLVQVVLSQGPSLIQAGLDLILSLCDGFTNSLPMLITAATEIIATIDTMLTNPEFLVGMVSAAADMLMALAEGIIAALPILIAAAPVIIQNLVTAITESLPLLLTCALTLIQTLVDGLIENLPLLVESALSMVDSLVTGIQDNLPMIVETAVTVLQTLIQTLIDNLPLVIETAITIALALAEGLLSCLPDLISAAFDLAKSLLDTIMETDWLALGSDILDLVVDGLSSMIGALINAAVDIGTTLWDEITSIDWWSLGSDIIAGIASGVSGAIGMLADAAANVARNALNTIKSVLGINSPSKVFAKEVGRWIPPGIGEGYDDAMPELNADMRKSLMHTIDDASSAVASEIGVANRRLSGSGGSPGGSDEPRVVTNENGITVIVYYTGTGEQEDIKRIGRQIGAETTRELRRKGRPTT